MLPLISGEEEILPVTLARCGLFLMLVFKEMKN